MHGARACAYSCTSSAVCPQSTEDLCRVNNNESSQDFNGNIISFLFVLSLAHNVFSAPAATQHREKRGVKREAEIDQLKDSLLVRQKNK